MKYSEEVINVRKEQCHDLKKLREKKGITLYYASKMLGTSHSYLKDVELGFQNPSLDFYNKYSIFLKEYNHEV